MKFGHFMLGAFCIMLMLATGIFVGQAVESQKYPEKNGYKCEAMKGIGHGFLLCKKL